MLDPNHLKDWLNRKDLKRQERLMIVLASLGGKPMGIPQIKQQAEKYGWKIPANVNISDPLSKAKPLIIKVPDGWEITENGKKHLLSLGVPLDSSAARKVANDLRAELGNISNPYTKAFAEEAIKCMEGGLWRSAIVMSWIGALHILYDYVIKNKLVEFNTEVKRVNKNWKPVKTIDELAKAIGESDFLDRIENIGVITNSVKKNLNECLGRRNSSGHPNSYNPRQNTIAHHVETLLLDVFVPFKT